MSAPAATNHLRVLVERIERLEEEIKALNDDKRDIYAEAKGNGFDVPTLKKVVRARKMDASERAEQDALFDLYMHELGHTAVPARAPARAREIIEEFDAETGAILEHEPQPQAAQTGEPCSSSAGHEAVESPAPNSAVTAAMSAGPIGEPASVPEESLAAPMASSGTIEPVFTPTAKPLRPHCLDRDNCAGMGPQHCWRCTQAMQHQEHAA